MLWMLGRKDAREAAQLNWRSAEIVICWLCLIGSVAGVGWPIDAARAQNAVAARDRLPLGAIYTPQATTFSIWSPDSDDVKLVLDGQALPMARIPDTDQYADVYRATVPGDHYLKRYNFLIRGKTVRDPYGVMAEPATNNNIVMDLSKTEPEGGWAALPMLAEREDAVIYELNVHDYTADPSSGVAAEKRGKFLGLVEHGTRVDGRPTGIDHLVDLGVTHVQIMPMFDYSSCPPSAGTDKDSLKDQGKAANSFNVPDPVNTIHWDLRVQHEDVYNYFKKTIALRRAHPAFRLTSWEAVNRDITTSVPRSDVVVNDIKSAESEDVWKETIVIYNSGNEFKFSLPGGNWLVAMERSQPVDQERSVTGSVTAEGTAVTVVHQ